MNINTSLCLVSLLEVCACGSVVKGPMTEAQFAELKANCNFSSGVTFSPVQGTESYTKDGIDYKVTNNENTPGEMQIEISEAVLTPEIVMCISSGSVRMGAEARVSTR